MYIEKLHTTEKVVAECAVVIDVLRAFTTAAFAFSVGAHQIIPVATLEEAFDLKRKHADYLLMGELQREPIKGLQLEHKGLFGLTNRKKILISSFVVAEATLKRILNLNPKKVSFVITGKYNGDEDLVLADYLEAKIRNHHQTDAKPFIRRIGSSPEGAFFFSPHYPQFPLSDLKLAASLDLFSFAMEFCCDAALPAIYAVDEYGAIK